MKKRLLFLEVLCLLFSMPAVILFAGNISDNETPPLIQATLISQDFETPLGWNGANPPDSGWTIIDNGSTDAVWDSLRWSRSSAWGGGAARVRGNSNQRYNNDWLISPSADYSGAIACTLFFRHYYNDIATEGADSALVMLSDNDGLSWDTTIFVYTGSDRGSETVPDSEYFNITSFAAGKSSIRVAFQYVKRQLVSTNVWQVDNIQLRADGSALVSENFNDSGWDGQNPPSGWIITHPNVQIWDGNDWQQYADTIWGNVARVNLNPLEQQREWLISPSQDLSSGVLQAYVKIKQWYDDASNSSDTAYILGSVDNGFTWPETLAVYAGSDHGSFAVPANDSLSMTDWAIGEPGVSIGFLYVGNIAGKWYLDNFRMEGIDRYQHDAAVNEIISPGDISIEGFAWPVMASVENAGLSPENINVVFRIADSIGTFIYSDTIFNLILASAAETTIIFDDWYPAELNGHSLICYTRLGTDADRSNDTVTSMTDTRSHRGIGGPVQNWIYRDNITGNGPDMEWVDITSSGTMITFSDDDDGNSGMLEMEFGFSFFNQVYNRVNVNINGWLSFEDSTSIDNSPSPLPDSDGPGAMIAALWADLHKRDGQVYYLADSDAKIFIVQYENVEFESISGGDIQMQVIIDGNDKSMKIQFNNVAGSLNIANQTIGIENQDESQGLAFNNNGEPGQTPLPGLAVTFQYVADHDVSVISVNPPAGLIFDGESYNVDVMVRNNGSATESFNVLGFDDHLYSSTVPVSELALFDSTEVSFTGWNILDDCQDYTFTVATTLAGDEDTSNDSMSFIRFSAPAANAKISYDTGIPFNAWYSTEITDVIANMFSVPYQGATISAAAFKFANDDDFPSLPDPNQDTIKASLFIDSNSNGIPDVNPIYTAKIRSAKSGWTIWDIGCDTTITLDCEKFWVGWSVTDPSKLEAIVADIYLNNPPSKWIRTGGAWQLLQPYGGDYMIRAYVNGNPQTAPNVLFGETPVYGVAQPAEADTSSNTLDNSGTGCDLEYTIKIYQAAPSDILTSENNPRGFNGRIGEVTNLDRFRSEMQMEDKSSSRPEILNAGGPDDFGYTWKDSDEAGGPSYNWFDISGNGSEVSWDYGTSNDGWTDPIQMGMTFNFYGIDYNQIVISSNGWVSFQSQIDAAYTNDPIPLNSEPNALIAVDWDDLDGGTGGDCFYHYDNISNTFNISWVNWSHSPAPSFQHNFQIILNGFTNTILFQYGTGSFQHDVSIGIENETGTDGLQIAQNEVYIHNSLAILISPPIAWLSTDLVSGVLAASDPALPFNIFMSAAQLAVGTYHGAIVVQSNDPDNGGTTVLDVFFEIEGVCAYIPGDVNTSGNTNGLDVTYMVNYFKGYGDPPMVECPECEIFGQNMIYPQGDVNGSCSWNGIDVSYFVNYLKGIGPQLTYCPSCPPAARAVNINDENKGQPTKFD